MKTQLASLGVLALCFAPSASAHYWLTKPVSREKDSETDNGNKLGCPNKERGQVTSFQAGETIDVRYWRNNHLGGFTRWAIVPSGKESKENFDNNVFHYTCRESGPTCLPKGKNEVMSGDNSKENSISCGDKITLPDYLPAGDYVIQVMWYGVGSSYGHEAWEEDIFKSCADIKLTTSGTKTKPACPKFVGGDRVTTLQNKGTDSCFYFYTTDISEKLFKGDDSKASQYYKFGVPSAVSKCGGGGGNNDNDSDNGGGNSTKPATSTPPATSQPTPIPDSSAPSPSKKICKTKKRR